MCVYVCFYAATNSEYLETSKVALSCLSYDGALPCLALLSNFFSPVLLRHRERSPTITASNCPDRRVSTPDTKSKDCQHDVLL
jgi:hypothetical protein